MIQYLAIIIIITTAISLTPSSAFALTNDARYNSGYDHGCSDAKRGGQPYLSGSGGASAHTAIFMNGYNDGYNACSTSSVAAPKQDFASICQTIQNYLVRGCGEYVSPSGALTTEGHRAYDCILGGGLLSGAGLIYGVPPLLAVKILEPLSNLPFYECGGIVQWNTLSNDVEAATFFLSVLGL